MSPRSFALAPLLDDIVYAQGNVGLASRAVYAKCIDRIRIAVAITMAVSATGFVICANIAPGRGTEFAPEVEPIGMVFVLGVYSCLGATVGLVLEGLVRWSIFSRFRHANTGQPQSVAARHRSPAGVEKVNGKGGSRQIQAR